MDKKINIRAYTSDDNENVIDLLRLNTPAYFSPDEESDLVHYLENEIEHYFVIEYGNCLIGCGGFNFSSDEATGIISWDIFHPDYQGKGFGNLLLNYRIEKLNAFQNVKKIIVRTSQLVWKFYEKSGFELNEITKDYWAPGFDLYYMEYRN